MYELRLLVLELLSNCFLLLWVTNELVPLPPPAASTKIKESAIWRLVEEIRVIQHLSRRLHRTRPFVSDQSYRLFSCNVIHQDHNASDHQPRSPVSSVAVYSNLS